jgi:membrane peptidoglycan carboxypeptidase
MAYDDSTGRDPRRDRDWRDSGDWDWDLPDPDPGARDPEPRGRRAPGDLPEPRGRASVPPPRDRAPRPGRPIDDRPPVPPAVARARVRPPGGTFEPLPPEPVTVVARATVGEPGQGRHARGVVPGLPRRLQLGSNGLRSRALAIVVAVALMLSGGGVLGGAAFFDSVQISEELTLPETTKILYSDGTELARLGEHTRYELPYERIGENVKIAIVASEDQSFWTNDGIDFGGVMRAAWNNFTGGYTQGASTITQQYARLAFELEGVTYQRKLREAVLAWKMTKDMTKEQILAGYLNSVSFGRGANGVEAAAKAFFGKERTVDNTAPPEQQLTLAEAMVLVAMVKQPYPDPDDPEGHPGYDPKASPAAEANARSRFDYVKGQLLQTGKITAEEASQLTFPETVQEPSDEGNGMEGPGGLVVNQVLSELTHTPGSPFYQAKDWTFIKQGGYRIYTTLSSSVQAAAINAVYDTMAGQPDPLQPALVAIQPGTGRVLAYYGGNSGIGVDYAGTYVDEFGEVQGSAHPPGSSFRSTHWPRRSRRATASTRTGNGNRTTWAPAPATTG